MNDWTIRVLLALLTACLAGCGGAGSQPDVVWAVNVGGPAYDAVDGTLFKGEQSIDGGKLGTIDRALGSQDEFLYLTYREGDINISHPIPVGTYGVTFHFAEPADAKPGDRLIDAFVEQRQVINDLDVMSARDGKIESALTVTIPGVAVADGALDVDFEAAAGLPILSALVVRSERPNDASWNLVWSDEFDYEGPPDPDKWNLERWPARKVNDEDQTYTDRPKNVTVTGGHLVISALKEKLGDAEYTSARVQSMGKGDFLYGRIEVRAKLPAGRGTWPAIWMLPSDPFRYATKCTSGEWQGNPDCDAWPNSGEIDIMEHVGYQMNHVHATVHNKAYYWINWQQRKGRVLLDDVSENFYTYALVWTPEDIRIFVDDTLYFIYVNEEEGWEAWPYDHPFHLVMNIAVGGYWGRAGGGIDESIFPQRMLVDFVRVYERAPDKP